MEFIFPNAVDVASFHLEFILLPMNLLSHLHYHWVVNNQPIYGLIKVRVLFQLVVFSKRLF